MEQQNVPNPFGVSSEPQEIFNIEQQPQQLVQPTEAIINDGIEVMSGVIQYAGFWARFAAIFVDALVLIIPTAILQTLFGKSLGPIMSWMLMWAYAIYMLNTRQATLGKMAVGLKVTTIDGGKPTVGKLAMREILGKILNIFTLDIGYLMAGFTEKKQGLHDMIAGTIVIYDPARKKRKWLIVTGVVVALIVPVLGILASVILVSTNSARQKALEKANKQTQTLQMQLQVPTQNQK